MAKKNASPALIADRYVSALFPLAEKDGLSDGVAQELKHLAGMQETAPAFASLSASPLIAVKKKAEIVGMILEKAGASPLTRRFVTRLALAGRLSALSAVAGAFEARRRAARGETLITITSAKPLSDTETHALKAAFGDSGKTVAEITVDPSLIAGVILRSGSKQLDYSLSGRLQRIESALLPAV